jgi:hypothetical protein
MIRRYKRRYVSALLSGSLGLLLLTEACNQAPADQGKRLEVWRKQADGKWKVVADIFNSDLAAPAPAEPKK